MKKVGVKDRMMLPVVGVTEQSEVEVLQSKATERPATGPGTMMAFMKRDSATFIENEQLRTELENFKSGYLTSKLDPESIVRSKWANRHEQSFSDKEFLKLKAEIDGAGGNVQPIKVRPLAREKDKFEVVFGHRRHQACLELGLPVLAMIEDLSDQDLFAQMDRENRERKDLRPYEQGLMYLNALNAGLFPSAKKMSSAIGVDLSNLSKSLSLARLPAEVLNAFVSPLDIQFRWATELTQAIAKDSDAVLEIAKRIQSESPRPDSKKVFEMLIGGGGTVPPPKPLTEKIKGLTGEQGTFVVDKTNNEASWSFKSITPETAKKINEAILEVLKSA